MKPLPFHPAFFKDVFLTTYETEEEDEYMSFHLVNKKGHHIDGTNLFNIYCGGYDPYSSIISPIGKAKFDLDGSQLKIIGVDEV